MRDFKATPKITERDGGAFDAYLRMIGGREYDPLSAEKEAQLFEDLKDNPEKLHEELFRRNLRFVVSVAKDYRPPQGLSMIDLVRAGEAGLKRAIEKFDHTRGFKLISYAVWWIRQRIMYETKKYDLIRKPDNIKKLMGWIGKAQEQIRQEELRDGTMTEVAERVVRDHKNISFDTIIDLIKNPALKRVRSFDAPLGSDGERNLLDVHDSEENSPIAGLLDKEKLELLKDLLLKRFSPREQILISMLLGLDDLFGQGETLERIAETLGLTRERRRQIKIKTIKKLQRMLAGDQRKTNSKEAKRQKKSPTLNLRRVSALLMSQELENLYHESPEKSEMPMLRPYQFKKLHKMIQALGNQTKKEYTQKPIVVDITPTRGGKTIMEAALAKTCLEMGMHVIFATSSNLILKGEKGALTEFRKFISDEQIGVVNGQNKEFGKSCTLVTYQSLISNEIQEKLLEGEAPIMLILDEGDLAQTELRKNIVSNLQKKQKMPMVTAFSATTEVANRFLGDYGEFSDVMHLWELQSLKYAKQAVGYYVNMELELLKKHINSNGSFDYSLLKKAQKERFISLPSEIYEQFHFGKQTLVACNTIDQAEATAADFRERFGAAISAEAIHSQLSEEKREELWKGYINKEIQVLTGVGILSRGLTDGGVSEAMILALLTESRTRLLQTIGRALGNHPDVPVAHLYQFFPQKIISSFHPATLEEAFLPTSQGLQNELKDNFFDPKAAKQALKDLAHSGDPLGINLHTGDSQKSSNDGVSFLSQESIQEILDSRERHWTVRLVEESFHDLVKKFRSIKDLDLNTKIEVEWGGNTNSMSWSVFRTACLRACIPKYSAYEAGFLVAIGTKVVEYWEKSGHMPDEEEVGLWIKTNKLKKNFLEHVGKENLKHYFEKLYFNGNWQTEALVEVDGTVISLEATKFRLVVFGILYPDMSYSDKQALASCRPGIGMIKDYFLANKIPSAEEAMEMLHAHRIAYKEASKRRKESKQKAAQNREALFEKKRIARENLPEIISLLEKAEGITSGKLPARKLKEEVVVEGESFTWDWVLSNVPLNFFDSTEVQEKPGLGKKIIYAWVKKGRIPTKEEANKLRVSYYKEWEAQKTLSLKQLETHSKKILTAIYEKFGTAKRYISKSSRKKVSHTISVEIDGREYEMESSLLVRLVLKKYHGAFSIKWDNATEFVSFVCHKFNELGRWPNKDELPLNDAGFLSEEGRKEFAEREDLTEELFNENAVEILQKFKSKYGAAIEILPFDPETKVEISINNRVYTVGIIGMVGRIHKSILGINPRYSFQNSRKFFVAGARLWLEKGKKPSREELINEALTQKGFATRRTEINRILIDLGIASHDSCVRLVRALEGEKINLNPQEKEILKRLTKEDIPHLSILALKLPSVLDGEIIHSYQDPIPRIFVKNDVEAIKKENQNERIKKKRNKKHKEKPQLESKKAPVQKTLEEQILGKIQELKLHNVPGETLLDILTLLTENVTPDDVREIPHTQTSLRRLLVFLGITLKKIPLEKRTAAFEKIIEENY